MKAPADALLALVEEGRVDFGISVRPTPQQQLQYHHLLDDPFVLVCRRDDALATRTSVPWSVFSTQPCIASGAHSSIRYVTDAVFLRQREPVRPVLEYPSVGSCGALVEAGLGIAALPVLALSLLNMTALAAVPLQRPTMSRPIGIVTRIGRSLSPVSRTFIEGLLELRAHRRPKLLGDHAHRVLKRVAGANRARRGEVGAELRVLFL